jgi:hypothetical protein
VKSQAKRLAATVLAGMLMGGASSVHAQTAPAPATEPAPAPATNSADDWRFAGTLYLWGAGVSGETVFPPPSNSSGVSVGIDAKDLLNSLNGAFMGAIEGRKGRFGFLADYIYLNFKAEKSAFRDFTLTGPIGLIQIPADLSAEVKLGLKGNAFNLVGTYSYIDTERYQLQSLAGVRYLKIDTSLTYRFTGNVASLPPAALAATVGVDPHKWDAVIGAKGRWRIGDSNWTVPYYIDIGTGESNFTWQAMGGVGYEFGWGGVSLLYRHLDYSFSNEPAKNLRFSGPAGAVTFRW